MMPHPAQVPIVYSGRDTSIPLCRACYRHVWRLLGKSLKRSTELQVARALAYRRAYLLTPRGMTVMVDSRQAQG